QDYRGGGNFSGRMTAPLCFAGAVCIQILERRGIFIGSHIDSIFNVNDTRFDPINISKEDLISITQKDFPTLSDTASDKMKKAILSEKENGDSVGGVIESVALGLPVGIGEPIFDGIESKISSLLFAIPAVKGVEFGSGFEVARLLGSQNNDSFYIDESGNIKTKTNNHGGSLGGISSGMPLIVRTAFKPTPSISKQQDSISLKNKENTTLNIVGRHDPCIVQRALPCIESALAIAILDLYELNY
ncbi:MAG: chorismate synthase, partial [Clostridioides sp.]|nr:chorismate synthase [Clostridioides sp.]